MGEVNVPCTCTHGGCEANRCGVSWGGRNYDWIYQLQVDVKLPTIWKDEKQRRQVESREKLHVSESQRKIQARDNIRKVASRYVFPMISGSESRKAGAKPCGHRKNGKWQVAVARNTCSSQNVQTSIGRTTFESLDVQKLHTPVV